MPEQQSPQQADTGAPCPPLQGQRAEWGACLFEPESLQLVAYDHLAATWFGLDINKGGVEKANAEKWKASDWDQWIDIHDSINQSFPVLLTAVAHSQVQGKTSSVTVHCQDGTVFPAELRVSLLAGPKDSQILVTIRPLTTGIYQHHADLTHSFDALTGLADRRALAPWLALWRKQSPDLQFAVLFLDLDDFKQINDQHSHAVGDRVLQTLATRWQQCVRVDNLGGDLIVRYGGDEFVVLLNGIATREEVEPVVARLQSATRQPIPLDEHQFILTASIGVAIAPTNGPVDLDAMIATADRNMYAEKR